MKETLRLLAFVGLILLFPAVALTMVPSARFEILADEAHSLGVGGETEVFAIHDTGSGIELVCVRKLQFEGISCTPTGRNWR